jgi:hypothetical protein
MTEFHCSYLEWQGSKRVREEKISRTFPSLLSSAKSGTRLKQQFIVKEEDRRTNQQKNLRLPLLLWTMQNPDQKLRDKPKNDRYAKLLNIA